MHHGYSRGTIRRLLIENGLTIRLIRKSIPLIQPFHKEDRGDGGLYSRLVTGRSERAPLVLDVSEMHGGFIREEVSVHTVAVVSVSGSREATDRRYVLSFALRCSIGLTSGEEGGREQT